MNWTERNTHTRPLVNDCISKRSATWQSGRHRRFWLWWIETPRGFGAWTGKRPPLIAPLGLRDPNAAGDTTILDLDHYRAFGALHSLDGPRDVDRRVDFLRYRQAPREQSELPRQGES